MRARAGDEYAALFQQLQRPEVELFVAPPRSVYRGAVLGEGRRIEDDKAEFFAFPLERAQEIERVGLPRLDEAARPFLAALAETDATASDEESTASTLAAPAAAQARPKPPALQKASRTLFPFAYRAAAARWSAGRGTSPFSARRVCPLRSAGRSLR